MRIVFLADTHLGFDYPVKPRIHRRRRGPDFFANFKQVLAYARKTRPDLVLHGGDLFFRARVPQLIVDMVYDDLFEFAGEGIPLLIVPGNHERSILPASLFLNHPNIHIFDQPRTFNFEFEGRRIYLSGFPCKRKNIQEEFPLLLRESGWEGVDGGGKLLCLHQTIQGAKVGPTGFTFHKGQDVIRRSDLPKDALAILSGHIHRRQIIGNIKNKGSEAPPVIYPGSTERTSFAEREEKKGFYDIELSSPTENGWGIRRLEYIELPARPMVDLIIEQSVNSKGLRDYLSQLIAEMDPNSIVRLRCEAGLDPQVKSQISAKLLREILPETMNYQFSGDFRQWRAD